MIRTQERRLARLEECPPPDGEPDILHINFVGADGKVTKTRVIEFPRYPPLRRGNATPLAS
jgi:hypothetical protein